MKRSYLKITVSLLVMMLAFTACEDETYKMPEVSGPADVITVENEAQDQSVDFNISIDPGLTATYSATGTGVTVLNGSGDVDGSTITINFNAGQTGGAASITLTVTDSEGQKDDATAVISVGEMVTQVTVEANITDDTTWTSDKVYILAGRITVTNEATLTIEPGTIIKGQAGTGANATALLIARGAKLMAEGDADAPIIFTSVADELEPEDIAAGNFGSPNLDPDIDGLWGGVIILGKATISASNDDEEDVSEIQIEGIPTSDPNGLYGGDDDDDNSGVIKNISIRHGGSNIGAGNEINGLTLGGVGRGTVIENVEVVANQDDGIEWFGGTVNVTNAVVWNCNDDAIDADQSWEGTLDNFVVIAPGDHNFELDGPEGSYAAGYVIKNGYVIANDPNLDRNSSDLINTDDNTIVNLQDIFFTEINSGQVINRVVHDVGEVNFTGIVLDVPAADLADYVNGDVPQGVTAGTEYTTDLSVFGWTWAKQAGKF